MDENRNDGALTHSEVVKRSVTGAANSLVIKTISAILKFARAILLARLLAPEQFGLVGLGLVFVQFLDTIGTFGLNMQLVREEKLSDEIVSTHFWLRMGLQTIMVLATIVLALSFKYIYPDRILLPGITIVLGLIWYMQASYSTQEAVLAHEVSFQRPIILDLVSSMATLGIAPLLAWLGWGVWSLVFGIYFATTFIFFCGLLLYRIPWRPSLKFDRDLAWKNLRFGWTVVVGKQINYVLDQFDDFWAGTALGNQALGFYERAFQFARYPRQAISEPLSGVFFSTYSKFQNNPSLLSKSFFISNSFVMRLNGFFSLFLFVTAPELISLLIGEQWMPMVFTFQLMIVYCFLDPLILSAGNLLIAVGRPELLTRNRFIQMAVFIPLVIGLAHFFGIQGIGVAADIMLLVGVIGLLRAAGKFVKYSSWKLFFPPVIGLLIGAGIGWVIPLFVGTTSPWLSLFVKAAGALIGYMIVLLALEGKAYKQMAMDSQAVLPQPYAKYVTKIFGEAKE